MIDDFQQHLQQAKNLLAKYNSPFFWSGAERGRAVEQISHLVNFSQLLLLVTGPTGSGKTTILQQAHQNLQKQCRCCFITVTPMMNASQLFSQLWKTLVDQTQPVSVKTPEALLFAVRDVLLVEQPAVVFIDDALLLDVDALRLLVALSFKSHDQSLPVHFIISGNEALEKKLQQSSQLSHADLLYTIHLHQLTLEETTDYLHHYLKATTTGETRELTTTDLDKIHKQAEGNFSKLNMLVDEVLARKMDTSEPTKLGLPKGHLYAIGIVASTLLILLLVNSLFFPEIPEQTQPKVESSNKTTTIEVLLWDEEVAVEKPVLPVVEPDLGVNSTESLPSQSANNEAGSTVITIESPIADSSEKQPVALVEKPEKPLIDKPEITKKAEPVSQQKQSDTVVVSTTPTQKPAVNKPTVKLEVEKPQPKVKESKPVVKAPAKVAKKKPPTFFADESWYLKRPKSSYVLQVLGVSSSRGAKAFISQHRTAGNLKYFRTRYKGKPWYVVTIGLYPNRDSAQTASRQLPPKLRQQKPWARSIASVQADIRKNQ
ncbi:ATPase, T2SS/T4P/T4SS family [Spartinivicinus poritis]|uniref:ATPase, T2SS/T4P/T4SS family n=1 Tax=Spartinivicinus poritis TaxID=2994640 RepID=A0ABT5U9E3_9GAMM|nr:ATPase, T2SS/T4P/T4SS family [Spartinivicinus sp. A2-2]MDE1461774.1 ATPase, T2SS/T4P/T4SS family [Spartinivicinus sp. A2-2]